MSTTFGVKVNKQLTGYPEETHLDDFQYDANKEEQYDCGIFEVAFRCAGKGKGAIIRFTNPIAHLLPDDTPVYPMDNTAQGIFTIGDIKNHINNQQ